MKQLQRKLQTIAKTLQTLSQKVENIQKQIEGLEQKPPSKAKRKSAKAKAVKKVSTTKLTKRVPGGPTAYGTFLNLINKSAKGVSVKELKEKTGFNDKKIANLVYKAKKQGKIKIIGRGVYTKA